MDQILLLLSYFSFVIGYSYNKGWFSVGGLILLATGFILISIVFFNKKSENNSPKNILEKLLAFGLIFSILMANDLWDHDMNTFLSLAMVSARLLLWFSLCISFLYLLPQIRLRFLNLLYKHKFFLLIALAILLRLLMLKIVVIPQVDIFFNLKYRTMEILHLRNPYRLDYQYPQNIPIIPSFFPYGPLLLPLILPFNLLFKDPRYLLIASELITALVLYKLLDKERKLRQLVPLLFLYNPQALFFASLSAVDSIMIGFFSLFFYWFKQKKYYPAFLALTFVGGIKHAYALTSVFTLKNKNNKRIIVPFIMFVLILFISCGAFWVWDSQGLEKNLLGTFTTLTHTWIVPASLSFQAFLTKQTIVSPWLNFKPSIIFGLIPFFFVSTLTFFCLKKSLYKMSLAMAIALFSFIFFAPYALIQYYTVVSSLTLIAFCLSLDKEKDHA